MAEEGSALRSILAFFGVSVDTKELESGEKKIESFVGKLKEAGKLVAEAFAVDKLKEFINEQVEAAVQLKVTAARLGSTTEEVETFDLAAREAGLSTGTMEAALGKLNRSLGQAQSGGKAASTFAQLGIAIKDSHGKARAASDVMADLADKVAAIDEPAKKTKIAMELLGRGGASLIPLLDKGGKAFADVRAEMESLGGYTSKEFIEASEEAEVAQIKLSVAWGNFVKQALVQEMLPAFTKIVVLLKDIVSGTLSFVKATTAMSSAVEFFGAIAAVKAIGSLRSVLGLFGLLKPTIAGTARAFLGFAAPLALIGLLYLAFDDLYALLHGGESVIGDTIDELFGLGTAAEFAKDLDDTLGVMIPILEDGGKAIANYLLLPLEAAYNWAVSLVKALEQVANGDLKGAQKELAGGFDTIKDAAQKRAEKASRAQDDFEGDFSLSPEAIRGRNLRRTMALPNGQFGPPGGGGPTARTNIYGGKLGPMYVPRGGGGREGGKEGMVVHQKVDTKIEVHTAATDPKATGKAVGDATATAQQRANDRFLTAGKKP